MWSDFKRPQKKKMLFYWVIWRRWRVNFTSAEAHLQIVCVKLYLNFHSGFIRLNTFKSVFSEWPQYLMANASKGQNSNHRLFSLADIFVKELLFIYIYKIWNRGNPCDNRRIPLLIGFIYTLIHVQLHIHTNTYKNKSVHAYKVYIRIFIVPYIRTHSYTCIHTQVYI